MAWTPSLAVADIKAGPYILGRGAATSEVDVGEVNVVSGRCFYHYSEIKGGASLGPETTVEVVITGVAAYVTFGLMQNIGDDNKVVPALVYQGATLSTGPTKKTMTLDANTITGQGARENSLAARWVLHKKGVAALTDLSYDYVFPSAIVLPHDEEFDLMGTDGAIVVPCTLIAMPDTTYDVAIWGTDSA
jgi:hypothetical protein